ncbi:MAG: hypothetical protein JW940_19125 [Polyangiaceae bacterium]|nr:hypothetical protein [Polyangiaceae bacterium]
MNSSRIDKESATFAGVAPAWAWTNPSDIIRRAVNDGLVPTSGDCPDGLARLALVIRPTTSPDYHWYREDLNPNGSRTWSHKRGSDYATNLDDSNQPITDPRPGHANTGEYTYWGGYFCTCSSATEGAGHAVIE